MIDPLGNYTDTYFHQDELRKGRTYQTEVRDSADALFNKTVSTWSTTNSATGVTFVFLSRTDNYECEGQQTCHQHARTFTYDANGNPTQTASLGDLAVNGDERTTVTDWVVDATNWIHRPTRTALLDNAGATVRERWLYYDNAAWGVLGARGLLTKEESRLTGGQGDTGNPTISYGYDTYGNKTTTTDPLGCAATIVYEASQTFPESVTNCLGHQTTTVYDLKFGVITSRTDPYNTGDPAPTTSWSYDEFGRLTKVTGPLDGGSFYGTVTYQYLNFGNPQLQSVRTLRTTDHGTANHIWSEQYFDGLGRVDKTQQQGPTGETIITSELDFDPRGLVQFSAAPRRFPTETAVTTEFRYDALGRQTQVIHPDGSSAQLIYDHDLVTSIDENGHIKGYFLDAYDRVIRVEEVNGSETYATTYQYDTADSLTRVTNHLGHQTNMVYDYLGRKTSMTDPNMGAWTYGYDKRGNLTSQTDAKNQTLTFNYDSLSRIRFKTYPNQQQIAWTYDNAAVANSKGRLTKVVDLAATTEYFYDVMGRVTETRRTIGANTYTMSQTYNALSRIISETFPDGDSVTYNYNQAGWLSSVPGYIESITYNARGQKKTIAYNNGYTTTFTYNDKVDRPTAPTDFRLFQRVTSDAGGTVQNFTYGYDLVGNITSIIDGVYTGNRTFGYDGLNRLISASGDFNPTGETYQYDAIGNILQKGNVSYYYTDPLHPSAVTSTSDGKTYSYDANGNMQIRNNQTLTWDYDNRVTALSVTGGGFVNSKYDYAGIRVEKNSNLGTTLFPFEGYRIEPGNVIVKNIRIGVETFAVKKSTGGKFFYHNDHLGGVNVITRADTVVDQLVEYDPWGKVTRLQAGGEGLLRFTGQKQDEESGLLYYGGRYYDPELGRFISADPFVPEVLNPQSLNRYSYVLNNPVNNIDPSGYFHRHKKPSFWSIFGGIIAGAVIGWFTGGLGYIAMTAELGAASFSAAVVAGFMGGAVGATATSLINGGNPFTDSLFGGLFGGAMAFIGGGGLNNIFGFGGSGAGGLAGAGGGASFASGFSSLLEGGMMSPVWLAAAAGAGGAVGGVLAEGLFRRTAGCDVCAARNVPLAPPGVDINVNIDVARQH